MGPTGEGTLRPASLINSNEISITNNSKIIGKGTFSLDAHKENNNSVGNSSWWKSTIAIYMLGSNKVMPIARNLKIFKKLAKIGFKFVSSGEEMKSTMVAGKIIQYGFPFTKITTLPAYKFFAALSGLSVESIWGRLHLLLSSINCSSWPEEIIESISKLFNLYFTSATKSSFAISFM